jgi:vacuolar-type H+-ATPase subunit E/Vma4
MGSRDLIESLRKAGEEKTEFIRRESEQALAALRAKAERALEELEQECRIKLSTIADEEARNAAADANTRARAIRLDAEGALSVRLRSLAWLSLSQLRDADYPTVFQKLARELPALAWTIVSANPADIVLVKKVFPDAEAIPDQSIIGGLNAVAHEETIIVINTFEKRLERLWIDLLPEMMKDIHSEGSHETAAGS